MRKKNKNMQALVYCAYGFTLLVLAMIYFFVIYHLMKFSINSEMNHIMLAVFMVISIVLIISNILLFFSVDWADLVGRIRV